MVYWIVGLAVVGIGVGLFFFFRNRKEDDEPPVELRPLPASDRIQPAIFEAWNGQTGEQTEEFIARHGLWWHIPEGYGVSWRGRTGIGTFPALVGEFEPETVMGGLAKRARLRALNPRMKLLVQIGYTEGRDGSTDFPPDHAWWERDGAGRRVPGWNGAFRFNIALPEVRQHCANCCAKAIETGIWDGVMLDNCANDTIHVDLLHRVRVAIGNALIIVNQHGIAERIAPLVNGIFMEEGTPQGNAAWVATANALDYNERHTRQPAYNCLEVAGSRTDAERILTTTCLALTRSNGFVLYADPGPGYASTHQHAWHDVWDSDLGKPIGSTLPYGTGGSQRAFEFGKVFYVPPPGRSRIEIARVRRFISRALAGNKPTDERPRG